MATKLIVLCMSGLLMCCAVLPVIQATALECAAKLGLNDFKLSSKLIQIRILYWIKSHKNVGLFKSFPHFRFNRFEYLIIDHTNLPVSNFHPQSQFDVSIVSLNPFGYFQSLSSDRKWMLEKLLVALRVVSTFTRNFHLDILAFPRRI